MRILVKRKSSDGESLGTPLSVPKSMCTWRACPVTRGTSAGVGLIASFGRMAYQLHIVFGLPIMFAFVCFAKSLQTLQFHS